MRETALRRQPATPVLAILLLTTPPIVDGHRQGAAVAPAAAPGVGGAPVPGGLARHPAPPRPSLSARLPVPLQEQLRRRIQVFLAEKQVVGCGGLVVTDEMRVTVAAHASAAAPGGAAPHSSRPASRPALPGRLRCRARVQSRRRRRAAGRTRRVLAGESWSRGQVILSWPDVLEGARASPTMATT